jgi:CBS-domain-containing membrane protein
VPDKAEPAGPQSTSPRHNQNQSNDSPSAQTCQNRRNRRGVFSILIPEGKLHVLPHRVSERFHLPERVEVVDPRFSRYSHRYLAQATLAVIAMLVILLVVDSLADAALAAGLGSSVLILFLHPSSATARSRSVIGGHTLALLVGVGCSLILFNSPAGDFLKGTRVFFDLSLALSLGMLILIMAITNTEHPPAAGTVLGISMQALDPVRTAIFISAVILLAIIKYFLKFHLHDLI